MSDGLLTENPMKEPLGALSIGINKENQVIADLNYEEDSSCETDMNIVMTRRANSRKFKRSVKESHFHQSIRRKVYLNVQKQHQVPVFEAQEKALS